MPHVSLSIKLNGFVFVSGQMQPTDCHGNYRESVEWQTLACLKAIEDVLSAHQLDRRDIVKVSVWLKHVESFPEFDTAYAQFFGEHRPARSTVRADLMLPGALVEIDAIGGEK